MASCQRLGVQRMGAVRGAESPSRKISGYAHSTDGQRALLMPPEVQQRQAQQLGYGHNCCASRV